MVIFKEKVSSGHTSQKSHFSEDSDVAPVSPVVDIVEKDPRAEQKKEADAVKQSVKLASSASEDESASEMIDTSVQR